MIGDDDDDDDETVYVRADWYNNEETWRRQVIITSGTASHCRVLPPGEFNSIISEPLSVYSESFTMIAKASLTLARQTVYAMAHNLACQ